MTLNCICRSRTCKRRSAAPRRPSSPIGPRRPAGRDYGEAYWSLANLKTYRFTDAELARMRADEASPDIALGDRYHLCFALGKALEDRGEYAESFAYYERGNALKKTECRYRPEPLERNARLQAAVCTRGVLRGARELGLPGAARPSSSSACRAPARPCIEQILASHSQVEGTMELADIPRLVQELQGRETNRLGAALPGDARGTDRAGFQAIRRRVSRATRGCTAPASRASSTRCRIISGTSD